MSFAATRLLVAVNVVLAGLLAWLWVTPAGELRDTRWTPPQAIRPDFSAALAGLSQPRVDEAALLLAISDRPLFSPSRRPPPPPPPPAAAPPPDALSGAQLLGVFSAGSAGGAILRAEGRVRRASVNDRIGEWTLQKIEGGDATFVRGSETRVLKLARPRPGGGTAAAVPTGAIAPVQPGAPLVFPRGYSPLVIMPAAPPVPQGTPAAAPAPSDQRPRRP